MKSILKSTNNKVYLIKSSLLFLISIGLIACASIKNVATNQGFSLKPKEAVKCKDAGNTKITFLGVKNDSRCPAGTQCITAGFISMKFLVNKDTVLLGNTDFQGLKKEVSINNGKNNLCFMDVNDPRQSKNQKDYTVTIKISPNTK